MVTECKHGVTQCPTCQQVIARLPEEIRDDTLGLIDLVAGYYPKSKEAFDNLRQRVKEHWNAKA